MHYPTTAAEWKKVADKFEQKWQLPNCCGAIDGKHVAIQCPDNTGSLNFNYKGHFSKVLMALADAEYRFLMVDFGHFGGESDAGIFNKCAFGKGVLNDTIPLPIDAKLTNSETVFPYFFIGDEAFPLRRNLMRPYPRRSVFNHQQRIYNYRLSRARRIVENTFGILASRFRVFMRPLNFSEETLTAIVSATLVLHNYLIHNCSLYSPCGYADREKADKTIQPGRWRSEITNGLLPCDKLAAGSHSQNAKQTRDTLAAYLCGDGQVEWQDRIVYRGVNI